MLGQVFDRSEFKPRVRFSQTQRSENKLVISVVLTNAALFRRVVSFMDGLPLPLYQFAKDNRSFRRVDGRYPSSIGRLPQLAVMKDDLSILEQLWAFVNCHDAAYCRLETRFSGVVRCAVRFDRFNVLQWLETHALSGYEFETDLMDIAVGYTEGVKVMQWVLQHCPDVRRVQGWALRLVAYKGELIKMRWLHEHGFRGFSETTADDAACAGHVHVLSYLLEHRREGCSSRALDLAAAQGHLEVVRYLFRFAHGRDDRHRFTGRASFAMTKAALCGHAGVVAYLGRHQCKPLTSTLLDVVTTGELQVLRALCRYTNEGCLVEARRRAKALGHAEIVAFLSTQIAPTVWSCRAHKHSRSGPRRCQRKPKPA